MCSAPNRLLTTEEGQKARDAMDSQLRRAREKVERYAADVLSGAQVYLGGGEGVLGAGSLSSALSEALRKAAVRKFPRFRDADHSGWSTVFKRAKEGNASALTAVGHEGQPSTNPVVKEVKGFLVNESVLGSAVHRHFQAARYGWPKDAVNGVLAVLVLSEEVSAWDGARQVVPAQLTEPAMTKLKYKVEQITLSFQQRQRLKQLANALGLGTDPVDVAACLLALMDMASKVGGSAPFPPPPDTASIGVLQGKMGSSATLPSQTPSTICLRGTGRGRRLSPRWRLGSRSGMKCVGSWTTPAVCRHTRAIRPFWMQSEKQAFPSCGPESPCGLESRREGGPSRSHAAGTRAGSEGAGRRSATSDGRASVERVARG